MNVPTFRRNVLPSYSGFENKPRRKTKLQVEGEEQGLRAGQWYALTRKYTGANI
jgi:hypothetical protein